jgi:phage tail-like protein
MKLPGRVKYANIMLKRGMTADLELYNWHLQVVQGTIQRKNGSIILLDRSSTQVARWDFTQAFPSKCDGPDLNAEDNKIAFDSYEIVCTTLQRVQ